jgi:CRISPR-associated endonuclease/helicase Cas3
MNRFDVAGAALATEPPEPALNTRGFEYARAFQNRVIEWIHAGTEPVAVVRAPTGGGKTATFHELITSSSMTLLVYPTNALLRQQRERFEEHELNVGVLNADTLEGHGRERTENLIQYANKYASDHEVVLTNPDILQAAIQAMYRGSDPMRFFDNFDSIVYDEFHFYDTLAASGLLLQIKIIEERHDDSKILLASATPNEDFVEYLRTRVGLTIRDMGATYSDDGDQFRHPVTVVRRDERKLLENREEIAKALRKEIDYVGEYDEPHAAIVFNSAKDSNDFHDFLEDEYPTAFEHAEKDNGFDTNDQAVNLDNQEFYILNTTSKGEVGLDHDITTLYMENPRSASAFLQRFGRAGRQSKATVHAYGLGRGAWGNDVSFPTFAEQVYEGLESVGMDDDWLANLVGFRAAYAVFTRENQTSWFNQEHRVDFGKNIEFYGRWRRFISDVERELGQIRNGFGPGKYVESDPEAKLLKFMRECFDVFQGLRGQTLSASIKYPRGDRLGLTTYSLTNTLRNYEIADVENDDTLVLDPSDDDTFSAVTARLPAYESEPTRYDVPIGEIEDRLQTKIHRRIDQVELNSDFDVDTGLLHQFFRMIRITNAIIPNRITTAGYEIEVDTDTSGSPALDIHRRDND